MSDRYVTDTHALLWYLAGDPKLTEAARAAFEQVAAGDAVLLIPAIALAEAIWVIEKHRTPVPLEQLWAAIEEQPNWRIVPLDVTRLRCLAETTQLSEMHDRIVVCEAKLNQAPLITADSEITKSKLVSVVW